MVCFLLIFIVIDIIQSFYIRHLKKEISFRNRKNKENPVFISKNENRVIKMIKEIFWI